MDSDIRPWTIHNGQWMMDVFDMENGQWTKWTMDNGHLVLNIKLLDIEHWSLANGQLTINIGQWTFLTWTMDNEHLVLNIKLWTLNIGNWTFANGQ